MATKDLLGSFAAAKVEAITPAVWDSLLRTIEVRLAAIEAKKIAFEDVVKEMQAIGLARINEALLPAFNEIAGIAHLGAIFTAQSVTTVGIGLGQQQFTVGADDRDRFAPTAYLMARANDNPNAAMLGSLVGYDRATGTLTIAVASVEGDGSFNAWTIMPTLAPDLGHEARRDNPHEVTADQVGTYTEEEINLALGSLANSRLERAANLADLTEVSTALQNLGASVVGKALFAAIDATAGRTALQLKSGATTIVGTAATKDVGTGANNVVQLDASGHIPSALMADTTDAQTGTDANKAMSAARVKEAIAQFAKAGWEQIGSTQTLAASASFVEQSWTAGEYRQVRCLAAMAASGSNAPTSDLRTSSSSVLLITGTTAGFPSRGVLSLMADISTAALVLRQTVAGNSIEEGLVALASPSNMPDRMRISVSARTINSGSIFMFFGMR